MSAVMGLATVAQTVLMIRPQSFGFNELTAEDNVFQNRQQVQLQTVLAEFDSLAQNLRTANVDVIVVDDEAQPPKPDAMFVHGL